MSDSQVVPETPNKWLVVFLGFFLVFFSYFQMAIFGNGIGNFLPLRMVFPLSLILQSTFWYSNMNVARLRLTFQPKEKDHLRQILSGNLPEPNMFWTSFIYTVSQFKF